MSAPVFDFKITFRPGFQADMDARFAKLQFAFSQKVAATVDPYVPFDTGTLKNSVNQASDFKGRSAGVQYAVCQSAVLSAPDGPKQRTTRRR